MTTDNDDLNTFVAIRQGEVERLEALLRAHPNLPNWRLGGPARGRTPLHVVTDWPGYFPNGPRIAELLLEAGADVDARSRNDDGETPLHWTASSDDTAVARVLIAGGADIEAADGSIGTPLDNAIGYGCWNVAHLLVERGARVDKPWHAAALGMLERLEELLRTDPPPGKDAVDQALWHACAGGQRREAEILVEFGADLGFTRNTAGAPCSTSPRIMAPSGRTSSNGWKGLGCSAATAKTRADVDKPSTSRTPCAVTILHWCNARFPSGHVRSGVKSGYVPR